MHVRWPIVAFIVVCVGAVLAGCNNDTTTTTPTPTLTATIAAAPTAPTTGSVVTLTVTPSAAGTYTIRWTADKGSFSRTDTTVVKWTAPDQDGTAQIAVLIGNATNAAAATKSLVVSNYTAAVEPHYLGAQTCNGCHVHVAKYTSWLATGHAGALGLLSSIGMGSNPDCIGCHTVGYDANVANGGYDEQMVPRLANVQCENCHGAASAHVASGDNSVRETVTKQAALCGGCHNGFHHPTYDEWAASGHGHLVYEGTPHSMDNTPAAETGCAKCHNGLYSMDYLDDPGGFTDPTETITDTLSVACAVCHDPHGNGNPAELRQASVTDIALPDGSKPSIGAGRLCIACHNGRRAPRGSPSSIENQVNDGRSNFGPHHSNQGDMLAGVDGYPGVNVNFTFHTGRHIGIPDGCVSCHTHQVEEENPTQETPNYMGHRFDPTKEACQPCHGTIDDFDSIIAKGDYDGNGQVQGIQTEVESLLDIAAETIITHSRDDIRRQTLQTAFDTPNDGGSAFAAAIGDSSVSSRPQRAAGYNYFFVKNDGSMGVHNSTYAIELLQQSIWSLDPNAIPHAQQLKK